MEKLWKKPTILKKINFDKNPWPIHSDKELAIARKIMYPKNNIYYLIRSDKDFTIKEVILEYLNIFEKILANKFIKKTIDLNTEYTFHKNLEDI